MVGFHDADEAAAVLEAISEVGDEGISAFELFEDAGVESLEALDRVMARVQATVESIGFQVTDIFGVASMGENAKYIKAVRIEAALETLHRLEE